MDEEITESAKAIQEVAKTTGQVIAVIDRVGQFFSRVMKEPIDATCGMITDTLKYKRWERQVLLIEKAEKIIKQKGLANEFRPIPPKIALPVFQYASLEDEDFLHDLWAKLLVSCLDTQMNKPRTVYVEIIKQLDALDVRILKRMYELFEEEQRRREEWSSYSKLDPTYTKLLSFQIREHLPVDDEAYWASVDNLRRQGLSQSYIEQDSIEVEVNGDTEYPDVVTHHGGYDDLAITALGLEFVKVCTYGDNP